MTSSNPAFFANNFRVLDKVVKHLNYTGTKWIYDGKIGDVYHTNEKYANYIFRILNASGVTLNPYVGYEALTPFTKFGEKLNFLVCRTSNTGSEFIQDEVVNKVYEMSEILSIGLVIPSNNDEYLKEITEKFPEKMILSPGVGIQGGNINKNVNNKNIIYTISRSIINCRNPREELIKYIK